MDFTPPKQVGEEEIYAVDFKVKLKTLTGVIIISATWRNSVAFGTDANPIAMIRGQASISGSVVSTYIIGGVAGCGYYPKCDAVLSNGEKVTLPDDGEGLLLVKP